MEQPFPAYQGDGPYAFVCYSHDDADDVYAEMQWLANEGINLWYDEGIGGGEVWRAELARAIENASAIIYFVSAKSVASQHCSREISYALDRDLKILPVYLADVELPADLRIGLSRVQALFRDTDADYRQHLLSALKEPNLRIAPRLPNDPGKSWRVVVPVMVMVALLLGGGFWWYDSRNNEAGDTAPLTSVAVMPFDDRSPGGGQEWLATGISETLVESLGRIEQLRIPGQTSTASLKAEGAGIRSIGDRLDVGSVIEGSVQLSGDDLQVSARWVRVDDEKLLWSARYPRKFEDVFDIQREIAAGIAEAVRTELGIRDVPDFMARQRYMTTDVRAWKALRRVIDLTRTLPPVLPQPVPEWAPEAEGLALQAIDFDPNYAEAYAMLGTIHDNFGDPDDAAAAKRQALELDPTNATAHLIFAFDNMMKWDFKTATSQFERASGGNPSISRQMSSIAAYFPLLTFTDRRGEALALALHGVDREPLWPVAHHVLGTAYLYLDEPDYEAAIEAFERTVSLSMDDMVVAGMLALAYAHAGREIDALETQMPVFQVMARAFNFPPHFEQTIRRGFDADGWKGMHLALAELLQSQGHDPCLGSGYLYASAGATDAMYECLEQVWSVPSDEWPDRFGVGGGPLWFLLVHPRYTAYRSEPRFQALIGRVQERIAAASGTGDPDSGDWVFESETSRPRHRDPAAGPRKN